MMSKRIAIMALSVVPASLMINADVLDPAQAWNRAASTTQMHKISRNGYEQAKLLHTIYAQMEPASYIFKLENTQGYVVVAADDAVAPLLGYSDNEFDAENIPDDLSYWLEEYSRQIEWARANGVEYTAPQHAAKSPINPMTKTKWNQNAPYNDLCPTYNGKKCVTGCVATAGAQAMKYYNWPDVGVGEISYYSSSIKQNLSLDLSQVEFDWDNMLNEYSSSATDEQKTAVAELMQAVGYSVNMNYTPTESGAEVISLAIALADNFKYDKGIQVMPRDYYGINDWNDIVYDQLVKYGPVIYGGQSNQGGHCFVCDGYSNNGYFHFNWGWGGMSDGYFLLTALDPGSQGIGGTTSAYNFSQQIIANVCKTGQGSGQAVKQVMTQTYNMPQTITIGQAFSVKIPVTNYSIIPLNGTLGFKAVSSSGTVKFSDGSSFTDFKPMNTASSWQARFSNLDNGTYTVTPAWYDSDAEVWRSIPVAISSPQSYTMTVSGNSATLVANGDCQLKFSGFKITSLYTNAKFSISSEIENTGNEEVYQTAIPAFVQNENVVMIGDMVLLDILPGESMELEYLSDLKATQGQTVAAGTYDLYIINSSGMVLYHYGTVEVNDGVTSSLNIGQLYFPDGNSTEVDGSNVNLEASVECTEGYFANTLTAYIFPNTSGQVYAVGDITSQAVFLNEGDQATLKFSGAFNGEVGESYFACIRYNDEFVRSTMITFTLGESGIYDVKAIKDEPSTYFNLNGIQIDGKSLAPGIYIKREGIKTVKFIVE